jgi:hypothetical protein
MVAHALAENDALSKQPVCLAYSPLSDELETIMEFRLTYEGPLMHRAGPDHVHSIRKIFHPQMRRLWEVHLGLKNWNESSSPKNLDLLAENFKRCGYRFVPLATEYLSTVVSLDILFLRSGQPGSIVRSADLDGRLKTLIDALRMPGQCTEVGNSSPSPDEDPFFCLMEDDKLVGNISVDSDTLLAPTPSASNGYYDTHDARLVITVSLKRYGGIFGLPFY